MQPIMTHTGLAVCLNYANVDTDQIIPKQFLSKVNKEGFGVHLFHDWRYLDEQGTQENPEFNLNKKRYKGASILISLENFGCGSSREHAPWALADFGFKVIIASSFADIFYANAINNGILPIKLSADQINQLMLEVEKQEGANICVDLEKQTVRSPSDITMTFEIAASAKHKLLNGLDAIGLTLSYIDDIKKYEENIPQWRR